FYFFFQAEDGIRDFHVTGVQTCALPIFLGNPQKIREKMKELNLTNNKIQIFDPETDTLRHSFASEFFKMRGRKGVSSIEAERLRSEERRVGKECRSRRSKYH